MPEETKVEEKKKEVPVETIKETKKEKIQEAVDAGVPRQSAIDIVTGEPAPRGASARELREWEQKVDERLDRILAKLEPPPKPVDDPPKPVDDPPKKGKKRFAIEFFPPEWDSE